MILVVSVSDEQLAIENFHPPIVRTDQPLPDYSTAVSFLSRLATEIGLETKTLEMVPGKPIFLAWIKGKNSTAPTIMLNSHMDVVPVEPNGWKHDPFAATIEQDNIYARGTQDMKSVTIQYLEAIRKLLERGWTPNRNILLTVVPDEEIGGQQGMGVFVESEEFQQWNIGFELDEGLASPDFPFWLYYGERQPWWISIRTRDQPAHGATLPKHTAIQRLYELQTKIIDFREEQQSLVNQGVPIGETVGINIVYLQAGVPKNGKEYIMNMVPGEAELGLDIRVPPTKEHNQAMEKLLSQWLSCEETNYPLAFSRSGNCSCYYYHFLHKVDIPIVTSTDVQENPYYTVLQQVFDNLSLSFQTTIFPASTDARYLREKGIPCFGFSPIHQTPVLLHDHEEYISKTVFLQGIQIYAQLIEALGSLQEEHIIAACSKTIPTSTMETHEEL
eukprot:jgi/Galph1/1808/GphlegSOOS_G492.1